MFIMIPVKENWKLQVVVWLLYNHNSMFIFLFALFIVKIFMLWLPKISGPSTVVHTQIIRPLARFYSYDYDLRKTNYIFKWFYFKEIKR